MKIFSKKTPSDAIAKLICDSGSQAINCEQCGRVHYDWHGEFMEKGELKGLEQKAKKRPEKYIGHDGDVHWGLVMGKQTVTDCPCNFLRLFEDTVWHDRHLISDYLVKRANAILKRVREDAKIVSKTKKCETNIVQSLCVN